MSCDTLSSAAHSFGTHTHKPLTFFPFYFSSPPHGRYDYVLNVCNNLNYYDDTCVSGSSLCQRHKHTQISTDVYGFANSIKLSWDDPDANATHTCV